MALYQAPFAGSGGGGVETTLWTNPSPTANFSNTEVTLSDNYTNYDKIRFYYRASTSDSTETHVDFEKTMIDNWVVQSSSPTGYGITGSISFCISNNTYTRPIRRMNSNSAFYIYTGYRLNASGTNQANAIPTRITGIN